MENQHQNIEKNKEAFIKNCEKFSFNKQDKSGKIKIN